MKSCSVCDEKKNLNCFYKRAMSSDGLTSACVECIRKNVKHNAKVYYQNNKEKISKRQKKYNQSLKGIQKSRHRFLMKTYGISLNQYNVMIKEQNHKCKVCGLDEIDAGKNGLHVDHNHTTGQVRALLCSGCNTALAILEGKSEIVAKLYDYLNYYKDSNIISIARGSDYAK